MQIQRVLQVLLIVIATTLLISIVTRKEDDIMSSSVVGGVQSANSLEIDDLARFAVQEHNKKENAMLEFARVIKAQEQVVAGTMHHLTLEVVDAGKKKICEAKIWVKPWLNLKELSEFKHVDVKEGEGSGYQSVPVQEAANHVIKTLQQWSNSLFPYVLQEVVHAKAETVEGSAKYDILLKVKRSDKEEKFKAKVHKDNDGKFHVNMMEQDHS